jgi:regulator of sirC expression with transglutaminase-like and TPR domain
LAVTALLHDDLRSEAAAFNVEDEAFDLFRAAILIGRIEEPDVNVERVSRLAGELAATVRARLAERNAWPEPLLALIDVLFHEQGFAGDRDDYDNPRNSFLHDVIETKRGLPIALSVLTVEIARRAGLDAFGIPFPGHFLVGVRHLRADGVPDLYVIDPFHKGRLRSPDDLKLHLSRLAGRSVALTAEHLAPADPAAILERMLNNLRTSFARRNDPERLARVLSRLLILRPGEGALLLERARARRVLLDDDGARMDAIAARAHEETVEQATELIALLDHEGQRLH